jgi:hypothetical protein
VLVAMPVSTLTLLIQVMNFVKSWSKTHMSIFIRAQFCDNICSAAEEPECALSHLHANLHDRTRLTVGGNMIILPPISSIIYVKSIEQAVTHGS